MIPCSKSKEKKNGEKTYCKNFAVYRVAGIAYCKEHAPDIEDIEKYIITQSCTECLDRPSGGISGVPECEECYFSFNDYGRRDKPKFRHREVVYMTAAKGRLKI